jgi:hypothetical protein
MGRPFRPSDAIQFLETLRAELARDPSMSNEELAGSTGASLPTVRKYRRKLQGRASPPRRRMRFVLANAGRLSSRGLARIPRPYTTILVPSLPPVASGDDLSLVAEPLALGNADSDARPLAQRVDSSLRETEENSHRIMEMLERIEARLTPKPPSEGDLRWTGLWSTLERASRFTALTGHSLDRETRQLVRLWIHENYFQDRQDDRDGKPISELSPFYPFFRRRP